MGRIFTLVYGLILGATLALAATAALATRYEYRAVPLARGGFYELQHDRWTGRECVAYSNAWDLVSYDLDACDYDVSRFVKMPR